MPPAPAITLTPELRSALRQAIDLRRREAVERETVALSACEMCGAPLPTRPARKRRFCKERCRKMFHWRHSDGPKPHGTPRVPHHGTEGEYTKYGCRCDLCRVAGSAARARRRSERREEAA